MKKLTVISLILVLSLMLAVMTGCAGTTKEQEPQTSPQESAAPQETPETPAETPAEPETQEEAEAPEDSQEPAEPETEQVQQRTPVEYPLSEDEPIVFSLFTSVGGLGTASSIVSDSLDVYPCFQIAQEKTNVQLEYLLSSPETTETKINLILASGDMPTFFTGLDMYYVSGRSAAIEDGVVVDLAPYLEECAPDYMNLLDQHPTMKKKVATDSGQIALIAPLATPMYSGLSIRQDWLEDLGMEAPRTYDELNAVLEAFKTEYGCEDALLLNSKLCGDNNVFCAGYGLNMLRGNVGSLAFEVRDGKVELFCQGEGFVDYMKMVAGWRENGYITNYMNVGPFNASKYVGDDSCGVWVGGNMIFGDDWVAENYTGSYDFEAIPIGDVTKTPGEAVEIGGIAEDINGELAWSVTTACDDIENAVRYLNWWYTEEGNLAASFGREGEAYEMVDGVPVFTELVTNNEKYTFRAAISVYVGGSNPASQHPARLDPRNSLENELQVSAKDIWYPENRGTAYTCYGNMTAVESQTYAARAGDIGTYLEEYMAKVVEGVINIDETYDEMIATCFELGLQEVLDIKQAAHDRYMNR